MNKKTSGTGTWWQEYLSMAPEGYHLDIGCETNNPTGSMRIEETVLKGEVDHGLPFEDHDIACIRAINVLHNVENPEELIDDIFRVLKPGGILVATVKSVDGELAGNEKSFWDKDSFYHLQKNHAAIKSVDANERRELDEVYIDAVLKKKDGRNTFVPPKPALRHLTAEYAFDDIVKWINKVGG